MAAGIAGFLLALKYVFRLRTNGLLWQAIVCSSFVWANVSNTKRSIDNPWGDTAYEPVAQGNSMANIGAFLMAVASARGVEVCLENPAASMIFRYPPLAQVLEKLEVVTVTTDQCCFSSKPYGQRFLKKFKLVATGTWVCRMSKNCRCPGGLHEHLMSVNETGQVSGTKFLKLSQAYPPKFGEAVVAAWVAGEVSEQAAATVMKKEKRKAPAGVGEVGDAAHHATAGLGADWLTPSAAPGRRAVKRAASAAGVGDAAAVVAAGSIASGSTPAGSSADWLSPRTASGNPIKKRPAQAKASADLHWLSPPQ
jgi:hypothetical protein